MLWRKFESLIHDKLINDNANNYNSDKYRNAILYLHRSKLKLKNSKKNQIVKAVKPWLRHRVQQRHQVHIWTRIYHHGKLNFSNVKRNSILCRQQTVQMVTFNGRLLNLISTTIEILVSFYYWRNDPTKANYKQMAVTVITVHISKSTHPQPPTQPSMVKCSCSIWNENSKNELMVFIV